MPCSSTASSVQLLKRGRNDGLSLQDCAPQPAGQADLARIHNNRGALRQGQGDFAGAVAFFNEALKVDAGYAEAYNNRGASRLS